jgi:hypothetical protein
MHRLVIVSGPNRGSSFSLIDGENTIGRQMDNHIVLSSGKVSKRHCAIMVTNNEVFLRDEGSTNGTFVNGTLIRKSSLKGGDKLGVGEFVLELVASKNQQLAIPNADAPSIPVSNMPPPTLIHEPVVEAPQDLQGKLKFEFEAKLMPFFYGNLMKSELRAIVSVLFLTLTLVILVGSVMPVTDLAQNTIEREAKRRAKVLARELSDRFTPAISNHAESQINLEFLEREDSVKSVAILDTNLQVIAPQTRVGQIYGGGPEGAVAMKALKKFKEGQERGVSEVVNNSLAIFIEPIRAVDPRLLKSDFAAMVVVSIDFSDNVMTSGDLWVQYGTGFLIGGIAALFVYLIIMRLFMKPFEVLNDDLDRVLRGELSKVTHEFKIEELNSLWSNINSAIQRISRSSAQDSDHDETTNWEREFGSFRALSDACNFGFISLDPSMNVVGMNAQFEEMSGMRMDSIGQQIQQVARDQSMISLTKDLMERVLSSVNRSATDEFEFSGVAYQVMGSAVGPEGSSGMAMIFRKRE